MRVKKLPQILALHLKRFKYVEQLNRYTKLSYRVLFPLELRLFNVSDDAVNGDRLYDLVAVVVHCGSTPNRGHYITVVKSHGFWLLFDDDIVDVSLYRGCRKISHITLIFRNRSGDNRGLFRPFRMWSSEELGIGVYIVLSGEGLFEQCIGLS